MKRVFVVTVLLCGLMMSCKKSDDNKSAEATCFLTGYTVYSIDGSFVDTTETVVTFNNEGQLLSIDDGLEDKRLIYDNGRLIRQESTVNGGETTFCDYQYDTGTGKLKSAVCTGFNGMEYDTVKYIEYTYNGNKLVKADVVDVVNSPTNNYTRYYTYDGDMNVTRVVTAHYNANTLSNSDSLVYSYTYDNARAPYEGFPDPLAIDNPTVNNRLSNLATSPNGYSTNYNFAYTYNEYNYPVLREETKDGVPNGKVEFHYSCDE